MITMPREPTDAMLDAADRALRGRLISGRANRLDALRTAYEAMLQEAHGNTLPAIDSVQPPRYWPAGALVLVQDEPTPWWRRVFRWGRQP